LAFLGLLERRLKRPRVDDCQRIARVHVLPLGEGDLLQLPVDAGAHRHRIIALHGSDGALVDGEILLPHEAGNDRHGRRLPHRNRFCCIAAPEVIAAAGAGDENNR
jgi:hypothetical protein